MSELARGQGIRLTLLAIVVLVGPAAAQSDDHLGRLRAVVAARPGDADARLHLATFLSWRGRRDEARREVRRVIELAPRYWDAHLLLARLDAWDGQYREATERVERLVREVPGHPGAQELLLDIAVWSGNTRESRKLLRRMMERGSSADLDYRLAVVEAQRLHYLAAYRAAAAALKLNPLHQQAVDLQRGIRLVSLDLTYELESFPVEEDSIGHGEVLVATFMPRAYLSATLQHELRYRFGTINNRLLLRGDWRPSPALQLTLVGGGAAPASVVSRATGAVQLTAGIGERHDVAAGYEYDRLPWAGDLHSLRLHAGARVTRELQLELGYLLGLVDRCDTVEALHALRVRGSWERGRWQTYLQLGVGAELDRPLVRSAATDEYDETGCPRQPGGASPLPLPDLRATEIAAGALVQITPRLALRAGYGVQLRFDGGEAHLMHLGAGFWK